MSSKIQKRIAPAKELDSTNSDKGSKGFQTENKPAKDSYPTRALIILTSLILLISYVETMVLPGIPTIQKDFLASAPVAAWITSSVLLVGAISSPLFGKFGDIYGKKKLILIALTFYTAGVGIAGFSTSIYFLIFARAIQGVGLAMFPLALAMVTDIFPKEKLAAAQGLIAGGAGISTSAGLVLGSYVIQTLGWRYAFHTAFILSVVLFVLAIVVLRPDVRFVKSKVDYFGAMLLMAGLALILIYLTEGSTLGWLSIEELVFLIPGIALIFGFFVFESKVVSPLIQLSLLKVRNVLIANLVVMVAGLANFLVFFAVVYFAEQPVPYGLGLDILSTGLMLAPATVAMLIVGPIAGRMVTKIGPKPVLLSGSLVSMVSYVLFIVNRATEAAVIVDAIVAFAG